MQDKKEPRVGPGIELFRAQHADSFSVRVHAAANFCGTLPCVAHEATEVLLITTRRDAALHGNRNLVRNEADQQIKKLPFLPSVHLSV